MRADAQRAGVRAYAAVDARARSDGSESSYSCTLAAALERSAPQHGSNERHDTQASAAIDLLLRALATQLTRPDTSHRDSSTVCASSSSSSSTLQRQSTHCSRQQPLASCLATLQHNRHHVSPPSARETANCLQPGASAILLSAALLRMRGSQHARLPTNATHLASHSLQPPITVHPVADSLVDSQSVQVASSSRSTARSALLARSAVTASSRSRAYVSLLSSTSRPCVGPQSPDRCLLFLVTLCRSSTFRRRSTRT